MKALSENPQDEAIVRLVEYRHRFIDRDVLDLHFLQRSTAEKVLRKRIQEIAGEILSLYNSYFINFPN